MNDYSIFDISLRSRAEPELHVHDFHEFYLALEGVGEQCTEEGMIRMRIGDLFFFPSGVPHIARAMSDRASCIGGVIYLREEAVLAASESDREIRALLAYLTKESRAGRYRIPLPGKGSRPWLALFRDMLLEEKTKHPGYRTVVMSLIRQFLVAILRGGGIANEIMLKREETAAEANVRDFLAFLSTHYMESVSVDEAARQANVSRSHFHATFRRIAGKPFTRYLQTLRVDAAKRLLAEGIGVDEAIRRSGFTSKSNFYRIFRAITGRAPAQIRHLRPGCDT